MQKALCLSWMGNRTTCTIPQTPVLFSAGNRILATGRNMERCDKKPWKILIVDDDEDVHMVTRIVLGELSVDGAPAQFFSANSMAEAAKLFVTHDDFAVALIDVIMETDDAGLRLVRFVREVLNNKLVRLLIRTGQPASYPPKDIVDQYEINDFKAKSELSSTALYVSVLTALRNYRDLLKLRKSERFLELLRKATEELFKSDDLHNFSASLISISKSLSGAPIDSGGDAIAWLNNFPIDRTPSGAVLAGAGIYERHYGEIASVAIPHICNVEFNTYLNEGRSVYLRIGKKESQNLILHFKTIGAPQSIDFIAFEFFRLKASEALDAILKRQTESKPNRTTVTNFYSGRF